MKPLHRNIFILTLLVFSLSSCRKWIDINSDTDTPQNPGVSSVLPSQLAAIPRGIQFDSRYLGKYVQNWLTSAASRTADLVWDKHGWVGLSDISGDIWRQTYFGLGKNLDYIIDIGSKNGQWDYVGVAYALKAYMFQQATDYHGEIVFTEAFMENKAVFKYDSQQVVYRGIRQLCDTAISYLNRTDINPNMPKLAVGDYVYNGDVAKWRRFVYGLLARNYNNLINKPEYEPQRVIEYADLALQSINDDFLIPFDATKTDDANFYGPFRDNLTFFRQSSFIVTLLDGTALTGSTAVPNRDPRIKHMLSASQDTTNGNGGYRGVNPGVGDPITATTGAEARKRVAVLWGDSIYINPRTAGVFIPNLGKYIFKDKAALPIMTYAEMRFIKAEAALRANNKPLALTAYTQGINAHFDFINRTSFPRGNNTIFNGAPISTAERNAYLNGPAVKRDANLLTYGDVMLQKYIALWGWGFVETWNDLRKYHYIEPDPLLPSMQVYRGFNLPAFEAGNLGKPAYRVRPRFNSEYVWNRDELAKFGGLNSDYHTYETWFSKP